MLLHNVFCTPKLALHSGLRLQCVYKRFQPYVSYPPPPLPPPPQGRRIGDTEGDESLPKSLISKVTHRRFFLFSFFSFGEVRLEYSYEPVRQLYVLVCYSYVPVCTRMFLVCYSYVTRMHSYVLVCYSYVLASTRMSLVCHPCGVLVTILIFVHHCIPDIPLSNTPVDLTVNTRVASRNA